MSDLTETEKKALKEKNRIIKLELDMEREMNKNKDPNPFDVREAKSNSYHDTNMKLIKDLKRDA